MNRRLVLRAVKLSITFEAAVHTWEDGGFDGNIPSHLEGSFSRQRVQHLRDRARGSVKNHDLVQLPVGQLLVPLPFRQGLEDRGVVIRVLLILLLVHGSSVHKGEKRWQSGTDERTVAPRDVATILFAPRQTGR